MGPLYALLVEVSVQVLCPFFSWIVCFLGVEPFEFSYILEIKPLSNVSLANMFCHTVGSLFILLIVSFVVQKCFSLTVPFVYFSFISLILGDVSANKLI